MTQEDPRELARRLAEQAKRKMASQPPPEPDPADDEPWTVPDEPDPPLVEMAAPPPVEERVGASGRRMSAQEALAAARAAEHAARAATRSAPPAAAPATTAAPAAQAAPRAAPTSASPDGAAIGRAATVVGQVFGDAVVEPPRPVGNADVFRGLWKAHRARAVHDGDLALAATACVLVDAIDRVPEGWLVACRVTIGGKACAAWVDLDRGVLLGVAHPADVFLSG